MRRRIPMALIVLLAAALALPATAQETKKVELLRTASAPMLEELQLRAPTPTAYGWEKEVPIFLPDWLVRDQPSTSGPDPLSAPFIEQRAPAASLSFEGYSNNDNITVIGGQLAPPDTEGDVGLDFYVQWNNLGWYFYDKVDPAIKQGPFAGNIFWQVPAFNGSPCQSDNAGDPIVFFDHVAQQWMFSQFTSSGNPDGHQCFAISTGSNPAGPYNLYDFLVSPGAFNDYPKIGLWTTADGSQSSYVMTTNEFTGSFIGVNITAFERDAMLTGGTAQGLQVTLPFTGAAPIRFSLQASHLEGPNLPPAGTCPYIIQWFDDETWGNGGAAGPDGYQFWNYCINWVGSSATLNTGPFVQAANFNFGLTNAPQPGTGQTLDPLGQFTMYRFHTRVTGAGLVRGASANTVDLGGGLNGIRWAEFDMPSLGGVSISDNGTLNVGDGVHRWTPSAALDGSGNLGIVYSRSGSTAPNFPSVYFTGRETGDPAGTLQTESVCFNGSGSQLGTDRWGDYAAISIDPVDDCTFWVTNEYVATTGNFSWTTRICSFTFPSCGGTPPCTSNADCDDGLFCNGDETCNLGTGLCEAGTTVDCDDGVGCTDDSCNEGTNSCDNDPNNGLCDNGLFCDGSETCDPVLDCQPGTDPCAPLACDEVGNVCIGGASPQLESACLNVGGASVPVSLTNTYVSPVVVTTVQYNNNTTPVVTRVSGVGASGFNVRLQNPSGGGVATENVCYLVVEEGTWTIDGVNIEAQRYTSTVTDEAPSGWTGQVQSYNQSYTNPVVLGQVMSEADPGFSVFWEQGASLGSPPSAAALTTGKTVCEDTDITRNDETVGFVVFEAGHGTIGGVEFEAALGADTVLGVTNAPPYVYTFNSAFAGAPTVANVQMAGVDGNNGGWAQVHGAAMATATTLNLSIDEDQIADTERNHTSEQVSYVVFAGPVVFPPAVGPQARLEWGSVTVGSSPVTVNLTNTYTSPVIVTAVQYAGNTIPVVTRISSVGGGSFDINLQNAGAGTVVADNVSYLVVEEGDWNVGGVAISASTYNSTVTDENGSWVGQAQSYGQSFTDPVVLGQVMSLSDPDWSVFWDYGTARTNPPSAAVLNTGKTVCEDTNITRANETVGIVVIEAGHGNLGGIEFEAALGADTVLGVTNSPPYVYTFNTAFTSAPSVAVVTMAGVDGGNGGWAQVHGATLATTTSLFLSIDEDTIGDSERNHISEQVGYVAFASSGAVTP